MNLLEQFIELSACVPAQSLQSCPTLCNPMDCSPPGFSLLRISQATILEWVAMPSSRGSSQPKDWTHVSWISCIVGRFFTSKPPGKPFYLLELWFIIKGCISGLTSWKRYLGWGMGNRHGAPMPFLHLQVFTNLEALQTLSFWVFTKASLHRHDWWNHLPLAAD